jgi:hypothetical protein
LLYDILPFAEAHQHMLDPYIPAWAEMAAAAAPLSTRRAPPQLAHDALHLSDPRRIKVVGDLDVSLVRTGDLESEPRAGEPDQFQAEVVRVGIVVVGLDVADATVILVAEMKR